MRYWLKVLTTSKAFDVCIGEVYAGQTIGWKLRSERNCSADRYREIGCTIETWETVDV